MTVANKNDLSFVSATYCSKECQIDDWKQGGHKLECQKLTNSGLLIEQKGGNRNESKNANLHENIVGAVGGKFFFSYVHSIIMQALLQKYDILDCAVVIDLCDAPPTVEVMLASVFLSDSMVCEGPDNTFCDTATHLVEQNRQKGALTVAVRSVETVILKSIPKTCAQFGSWRIAQAEMKVELGGAIKRLQLCPDALKQALQEIRHGNSSLD